MPHKTASVGVVSTGKKYPFNLLDKCYFEFNENMEYEICDINARELLNYNRFDLYANLVYIDHKEKHIDISYALDLYKARTQAITGGVYKEQGNEAKDSFKKYIAVFDRLIDDFKQNRFNREISLIPVRANNVLIDGSHRVSCAAYFNKIIRIVKFKNIYAESITSQWLEDHFLLSQYLDRSALEYCKWNKHIYMLCIWPKTFVLPAQKQQADNLIIKTCAVVYRKKLKMSYTAIRNMMIQIYSHMDWIGTVDTHFRSVFAKVDEVWNPVGTVEFILIESDTFQKVFNLKQQIREIYGIKLGSMHSSDNYRETYQIANLIYNSNSMHHLETSQPEKYVTAFRTIEKYKEAIKKAGDSFEDYIIDSSMAMAIYGIRDANDLDYLTSVSDCCKILKILEDHHRKNIEYHRNDIEYHGKNIESLIYNPNNYFIFNELKFISLDQLSQFKQTRYLATKDAKDINDIKMIAIYKNSNQHPFIFFVLKIKNSFRRNRSIFNREFKNFVFVILKKIHLYNTIRTLYRTIKINKDT
jgi:hypothetical protein